MGSVDVKKKYKEHYDASSKKIMIANVQEVGYIMIRGIGNPNVSEFVLKSDALFMIVKEVREILKEEGITYTTPPLEGIWDTYDNAHFDVTRKQMIPFTLMMALVEEVNESIIDICKSHLLHKTDNPYIMDVYYKKFKEGRCVQMLHRGAYHTEINTTKQIMEYITVENMKLVGMHHEIYLNNPKKVAEEDLKTIVRYAIEDA
ncbi:GyrI-like domain-containing protein [Tannockella kyphosi]|uniref:GyrI-like domain-containing protein n=1 Tax=Tannockella kyphosi TaxID=2899121 RepID=UPI0020118BF9|nr:GyrI-like domain-containing protein [Tannockella kyphosi]